MAKEIFDIVKLPKGGRIRVNGGAWHSEENFSKLTSMDNGGTQRYVMFNLGNEPCRINFSDDEVNIDEGSGFVKFPGSPVELHDKLHDIFFRKGSAQGGEGGATGLLPLHSRIVYLGHSFIQQGLHSAGAVQAHQNIGFTTYAGLLSGNRFYMPPGGNKGVGGETSLSVMNRTGAALALNPKVVVLCVGTNEITSETAANILLYQKRIIRAIVASGAKAVVLTITPRFGGQAIGASNETKRQTVNAGLKALASSNVIVLDCDLLVNGEQYYYDGLHLNALGSFTIGKKVAEELSKLVAPGRLSDVLTLDNANNPALYWSGTTGSKGSGATGTVAAGLTLNANSIGAAVVASIEQDSDGNNVQVIEITGNYSGSSKTIDLLLTANSNLPALNDVVEGVGEYEIVTNDPNVISVSVRAALWGPSFSPVVADLYSMSIYTGNQDGNPLETGVRYVTRTPPHTLTAAAPANMGTYFQIFLKNQASATPINFKVKFYKLGMRKVPTVL